MRINGLKAPFHHPKSGVLSLSFSYLNAQTDTNVYADKKTIEYNNIYFDCNDTVFRYVSFIKEDRTFDFLSKGELKKIKEKPLVTYSHKKRKSGNWHMDVFKNTTQTDTIMLYSQKMMNNDQNPTWNSVLSISNLMTKFNKTNISGNDSLFLRILFPCKCLNNRKYYLFDFYQINNLNYCEIYRGDVYSLNEFLVTRIYKKKIHKYKANKIIRNISDGVLNKSSSEDIHGGLLMVETNINNKYNLIIEGKGSLYLNKSNRELREFILLSIYSVNDNKIELKCCP